MDGQTDHVHFIDPGSLDLEEVSVQNICCLTVGQMGHMVMQLDEVLHYKPGRRFSSQWCRKFLLT